MTSPVVVEIEMPAGWEEFRPPEGLHGRLHELLDRQDQGSPLSEEEREEAQGLVDLEERLSLLRLQVRCGGSARPRWSRADASAGPPRARGRGGEALRGTVRRRRRR